MGGAADRPVKKSWYGVGLTRAHLLQKRGEALIRACAARDWTTDVSGTYTRCRWQEWRD